MRRSENAAGQAFRGANTLTRVSGLRLHSQGVTGFPAHRRKVRKRSMIGRDCRPPRSRDRPEGFRREHGLCREFRDRAAVSDRVRWLHDGSSSAPAGATPLRPGSSRPPQRPQSCPDGPTDGKPVPQYHPRSAPAASSRVKCVSACPVATTVPESQKASAQEPAMAYYRKRRKCPDSHRTLFQACSGRASRDVRIRNTDIVVPRYVLFVSSLTLLSIHLT